MLQKGFAHLLVVFFIAILGIGYVLFKSTNLATNLNENLSNPGSEVSPTIAISNSLEDEQNIDLNETNKYTNRHGFSILYPKFNKTLATNCDAWKSGKVGTLAFKVFEEPALNTIYIAEESVLEFEDKYSTQGKCKDVQRNLASIKKELDIFYDFRNTQITTGYYSTPLTIKYKTIKSDSDLVTLAQSIPSYKNCSEFTKKPLKDNPEIYNIWFKTDSIADDDTAEDVDKKCILNFAYIFLYSPKNQVGVITSGSQEAYFNGTNGQGMPIIEFEDK